MRFSSGKGHPAGCWAIPCTNARGVSCAGSPMRKILPLESDLRSGARANSIRSEELRMAMTNRHTGATGQASHHDLPATAATVHWGYLSRSLKPVLSVKSGDFVTIEALTHHAYDDYARM